MRYRNGGKEAEDPSYHSLRVEFSMGRRKPSEQSSNDSSLARKSSDTQIESQLPLRNKVGYHKESESNIQSPAPQGMSLSAFMALSDGTGIVNKWSYNHGLSILIDILERDLD